MDATVKKCAHLVYHAFVKAVVQSLGDAATAVVPVDVESYHDGVVYRVGGGLFRRVRVVEIKGLDFDCANRSLGCVYVCRVVQSFH